MERIRLRIFGIVQGVGFRPFVVRMAHKNHVTGSVCNKGPYVEVFVQGNKEELNAFKQDLRYCAPERSMILKIEEETCDCISEDEFVIIQSQKVKGEIFVSPDIATCPTCQKELFDPANRRYLHPFINCTACGPRLTILDSMPYDRERTSMKSFEMCDTCHYEYTHEETRRYHAQPVCCNDCGPELYILNKEIYGKEALIYIRDVIRKGGIVAIKGIGGFHLCCDATNNDTILRLRQLKNRPFKPLSVMMKNMDVIDRECEVLKGQEKILNGPQKPILLLNKKQGKLASGIAPDNPTVGVMLPYAPIQYLLFDYPDGKEMPDCLVMTSANPKGAPICRNDQEIKDNLLSICDEVLSNDRPIRLRADDSVMNWLDEKPYMIRRSRGYAPLPVMTQIKKEKCVLGIGGELKNCFCLAKDDLYYPSPYIGDLQDMRSVTALKQSIERMSELLEMKPEVVVCDKHPQYNSRRVAEELGLPVMYLQHHYAHVLSCMAENDWTKPVIGVAMDGTGYGDDGTIWGGEFFVCDTHGYQRVGSLQPFWQAGGDLSSKEGWRIAASLLDMFDSKAKEHCEELGICSSMEYSMIHTMIKNKINTIQSTSVGRLFDGISALLGLRRINTCEGEASMVLEFEARKSKKKPKLEAVIKKEERYQLDIESLIQWMLKHKEWETSDLAYAFHAWLANGIVQMCEKIQEEYLMDTVALTGGVMQNVTLCTLVKYELDEKGMTVLMHQMIPSNDGGIGLGQAYYAMCNDEKGELLCV